MVRKKKNEQLIFCCECVRTSSCSNNAQLHSWGQPPLSAVCLWLTASFSLTHTQTTVTASSRMSRRWCSTRKLRTSSALVGECSTDVCCALPPLPRPSCSACFRTKNDVGHLVLATMTTSWRVLCSGKHHQTHSGFAECHRKLNTAQGLSTHCYQVHKISLKQ